VKRLVLVAALVACGSHPPPADHTPPPVEHASDPTCPVEVPGTSVTVEDTNDGAALVFVTTGNVAEVRKRAQALVEAHNANHAQMDHEHMQMPPEHHGMGTMISTHSQAAFAELPNGARVTFTGDAQKLQSELRMHAQHLATGSCEMKM
jgi:hypothetical protein